MPARTAAARYGYPVIASDLTSLRMDRAPFFIDEDQAWADDWLRHVTRTFAEKEALVKRGSLNFLIIYEDGKVIAPKKSRNGSTFGTHFSWKIDGQEPFTSDEMKMLFWRGRDSDHLQEWLQRCDSRLPPVDGK
jgi:hypothetical protein